VNEVYYEDYLNEAISCPESTRTEKKYRIEIMSRAFKDSYYLFSSSIHRHVTAVSAQFAATIFKRCFSFAISRSCLPQCSPIHPIE